MLLIRRFVVTRSSSFRDFETLESYITKQQKLHVNVRGTFSQVLRRIGVASKIIESKVRKAGLVDILGVNGSVNVQGEHQVKLDDMANSIMKAAFSVIPSIAGMATEEEEDFTAFDNIEFDGSRYLVMFDPLDGSSNVDANVSIGTIFAVLKYDKATSKSSVTKEDFFKPGRTLSAAGYVIYGSSTMFVYTTGQGVHGFTLDPEIGEFVLSHENIKIPDQCKCFSANETNYNKWDQATKEFADTIRYSDDKRYQKASSRYIGSLVADFHRNLLYGGIYMYPTDVTTNKPKLRLLYECAPLAMIAEQAGGMASTGTQNILDIVPNQLHQRVPIVIGNKKDVEFYEELVKKYS